MDAACLEKYLILTMKRLQSALSCDMFRRGSTFPAWNRDVTRGRKRQRLLYDKLLKPGASAPRLIQFSRRVPSGWLASGWTGRF